MKREIDARAAIRKLRAAQLLLWEVHDRCLLVGYSEVREPISLIGEIKERLNNQVVNSE